MRLPNFFVLGAAKAGTTALYHALAQHPDIYMSPVKEPHFFAFEGEPPLFAGPLGDSYRRRTVWQAGAYAALFAAATSQRAIGEASVGYLFMSHAPGRIRRQLPASRLIAILRQPADRAYSSYLMMRSRPLDPAATFEEALAQEARGAREGWLPVFRHKELSHYCAYLGRYYALFPAEQIKVCLYEDWQSQPLALLQDIFRFLRVDDSFIPQIPRSNVSYTYRSHGFHQFARRPQGLDPILHPLLVRARSGLLRVLRWVDKRWNVITPPPIQPETRTRLTAEFREEILRLQALTDRDLSHWLTAETPR